MDGKMLVAVVCCIALLHVAEATLPAFASGADALKLAAGKRNADNFVLNAPASGTVYCAMGTTGADTSSYTCSPTSTGTPIAIATGISITRNSMATTPGTETISVLVTDAASTTDVLTQTLTITVDNNNYWSSELGYVFCISGAIAAGGTVGTAAATTPTGGATLTGITSSEAAFAVTTAGVVSAVSAIASDAASRSWLFTLTAAPTGTASKAGTTTVVVVDSSLCPSSAPPMITATITILLAALFNLVMKRL